MTMMINEISEKMREMRSCFTRPLRSEGGFALVAALLVMGALAVIGAVIVVTSTTDMKIARNVTRSSQAFTVAEGGLSAAINNIRNNLTWGPDMDEDGAVDATWAAQSTGTFNMGSTTGSYTVAIYDSVGSFGRLNNEDPIDRPASQKYATLTASDMLLEVTGTVNGISRTVSLILRPAQSAFNYASYSDGTMNGQGAGADPGTVIGKIYGKDVIGFQGNYDVSEADAQSMTQITPNCSSGAFKTCDDSAEEITPPVLDFAYYQDQSNFSNQEVFIMTPTVGASAGCGANCTQWSFNYDITKPGDGSNYTLSATVQALQVGADYNHTVSWCTDPAWVGAGNCPEDGNPPKTFTFTSSKAETAKPFMDAFQLNAYTAPNGGLGYSSSIVNVFDATNHLEFLGPSNPADSVTVTASILVGTASSNNTPSGKIDIEGGAGTLKFEPANGLGIVAEKVKFVAKYSPLNVQVGTATDGVAIIATSEFKVKGKNANTVDFSMNGSVVVGDGSGTGKFDLKGAADANFTYTPIKNLPQGWLNDGTIDVSKQSGAWREWREL